MLFELFYGLEVLASKSFLRKKVPGIKTSQVSKYQLLLASKNSHPVDAESLVDLFECFFECRRSANRGRRADICMRRDDSQQAHLQRAHVQRSKVEGSA
jgi:hypothetical protein